MSHRVLIADPFVPTSGSLRRILESAQFEVFSVHYLDEAVQRIKAADPEVLFASVSSTFDGETLCLKAKELAPLMPVVLVYPPEEEAADEHARNAGADAFMLGPVRRPVVLTVARALLRQRKLQKRIQELETENDKLVAARLARPVTNPGTMPAVTLPAKGAAPATVAAAAVLAAPDREFEFFKRFLLMEVKRSRRFKHPMSFMLVEVDEFASRTSRVSPAGKKAALAEALGAISSGLRDIDLCVPASGDRFLVFLSHTPLEGALTVAERMRARVAKMKQLDNATVSVGIASYEGGKSRAQVSFGSLMKDASDALKRAKAAGGNRAESATAPKRDRISLG